MDLLRLNIITPTGVKYRVQAATNATLADLRKSLVKDGILQSDARFLIEDTIINPASNTEAHMKWTEIAAVREIRTCRGDDSTQTGIPRMREVTSHEQGTLGSSSLSLVPLHRLYLTSPLDHRYTIDSAERDTLVQIGWGLDPITGLILASPSPAGDSVPFFQIYLSEDSDHLYTTDVQEKERLISQADVRDEGILGYVWPNQHLGTLPLYRLYHPELKDHVYTTNGIERSTCIDHGGWKDEGIACYVYA